MKCNILHETPGRMRVHLALRRMSLREADLLEYDLNGVAGVVSVKVFDRTQDAVITYTCPRMDIVRALSSFSFTSERALARLPEHTSRALNREYEDKLVFTVCRRAFSRLFLPVPVQTAIALFRSVKYIRAGLSALLHGKLSVAVLDATAVTVSMVRGDFDTAGSVMFMLRLGEILEEWTHKKSVADLAGAMALNVDKVWLQSGETELLVPIGDVKPGDRMIVRTGNLIPLDGKVVSGEATVNQASITGESMPAPKREGSYVYAGTVVEEGECIVNVEKALGGGRYDRIVHMIEESEKLKSTAEDKAARLADRLVPYTLGGTALTYLVTRNVTKMLAVLMVDFSCALKLAMPIANIPVGTVISCIELHVGRGAQLVRAAGQQAQLMAKEGAYAQVRLPSGEYRLIKMECRAVIGQIGNEDHGNIHIGKAGRKRHMGIRPTVRGSVMNPNDHPHGGGEGRAPIGRSGPVTPWGKPAMGYKTRKGKNPTNKFIVKRRNEK